MTDLPTITPENRLLTRHEFLTLQAIPPEAEWFADIDNPNTRRNYRNDVQEFLRFLGIQTSDELRQVQPAHIIAWRKALLEATYQPRGKNSQPRKYAHATIRRKLAAVSSLFETLVEKQAITHNPTKGVKRPARPSEKTPILPDDLMARLLNAPDEATPKGIRDRAMLSTFAHLALREAELAGLRVGSYGMWDGVMQCKVEGKGDKLRYVEVDPGTQRRLEAYFAVVGHREDLDGPLFRPLTSGGSPVPNKHLSGRAIHKIIMAYAKATGIQEQVRRCNVHALRTTAANNARNNGAALDEVQKWMGHADISTTRKHYVHTGYLPENSPSFKVRYNG